MANQNILQRAQVKGTTQTIKSYAGIDGQLVVNKTTGDLHVMSGVAGSNKVLPCKQTVSQMIQEQAPAPDLSGYLTKNDASNTYLSKTDASNTYLGKTAKAESAKVADSANSVPWSGVSSKPSTFPPSSHEHSTSQITGLDNALSQKLSKTQAETTYLGKTEKAQSAKVADSANSVSWSNVSGKPSIPTNPKAYVTATYKSGSSWYRKWSDGYIEQAGITGSTTVTFPIAFSSTSSFSVFCGFYSSGESFGSNLLNAIEDKSTTSFKYHNLNSVTYKQRYWYACGY